ncbi:MAG: NosD domain-containing protein [Candidatus Kariarchaeaceae archaeon]|jgi:parallel beta-helix repeat protein
MQKLRILIVFVMLIPFSGILVTSTASPSFTVLGDFQLEGRINGDYSYQTNPTYVNSLTRNRVFDRLDTYHRDVPTRGGYDIEFMSIDHSLTETTDVLHDTFVDPEIDDTTSVSTEAAPLYKKRGATYIDGNKELRRYSSGGGTIDDPYVIDWYTFLDRSGKNNLLQIQNTDAYFVISNNIFSDPESSHAAIVLNNVQHGLIDNNDFTYNTFAIYISNSNDIVISNNNIAGNSLDAINIATSTGISVTGNDAQFNDYGLVLNGVDGAVIDGNNFSNNTKNGIYLINSNNNDITSNTVADNGSDGVFLENSNLNDLLLNTVYGNGEELPLSLLSTQTVVDKSKKVVTFLAGILGSGIFLDPSNDNTIAFNEIYDNTANGVYLQASSNNQILDNDVYSNDADGIFLEGSNGNEITFNDVYENGQSTTAQALVMSIGLDLAGILGSGIFLDPSDDNLVEQNNVYDNAGNGVYLQLSDNNIVNENTVYSNDVDGIFLENSNSNNITSNTVTDNGDPGTITSFASTSSIGLDLAGILGSGIFLDPSSDNVVSGNTVSGNTANGVLLEESTNNEVSSNTITSNGADGVFLANSSGNTIDSNEITGNGASTSGLSLNLAGILGSGIFLDPSSGNTITNNDIHNNAMDGVLLEYSDSNTISGNDIYANGLDGIFFVDSDANTVTGNDIFFNGYNGGSLGLDLAGILGSGIFLDPSSDNTISDNNIYDNAGEGVILEYSTGNTVSDNVIYSNDLDGVFLNNSNSNTITGNDIYDNGFGASGLGLGLDLAGILGSGIFLDPSNDNTISGNNIHDNAANGVFLESSNGNTITGNAITDNGFGTTGLSLNLAGILGSGIFLDPSSGNTISDNNVTNNAEMGILLLESDENDITGNDVSYNELTGIVFVNSSYNNITSNAIDSNGQGAATGIGLDLAGILGSGIFLDPSVGNYVALNNVTNHPEHGLFVEATNHTTVTDNRFIANGLYGVAMDAVSSNNAATGNNFDQNNAGGAQARDDGWYNAFFLNFWSDNDNNDSDYDGVADTAYLLDGYAGNEDGTPTNIPNGLNFANFSATIVPDTLNAGSDGTPVTAKIELSGGFRVLNITLEDIYLNKTINPYTYHIIDILRFTVTFSRAEVNALVNSLGLDEPSEVVFHVSGFMNERLIWFDAYDTVTINQDEEPVLPLSTLILAPIAPFAMGEVIRKRSKKKKL